MAGVNREIAQHKRYWHHHPQRPSKINLYFSLNHIPPSFYKVYMVRSATMGFYPLHIAASRGQFRLIRWLLRNGKVNAGDLDNFGNHALNIAAHFKRRNIIQLLWQYTSLMIQRSLPVAPLVTVNSIEPSQHDYGAFRFFQPNPTHIQWISRPLRLKATLNPLREHRPVTVFR